MFDYTRHCRSCVFCPQESLGSSSGRAEQELCSNSDEVILSIDESTKESKSRSPTGAETSTEMEDLDIGKETPKATRDPVGPEGEDQAGNSVHSVQVESAA